MTLSEMKRYIVVVDDNPDMQGFLRKFLTQEGYDVMTASNGEEALGVVQARMNTHRNVDLVLSDIRMPQMDGMTLVQKLKGSWPGVPVVLMTAYGTIESAVAAMKHGAQDYLTKPFKLDDVRETVKKCFEFGAVRNQILPPVEAAEFPTATQNDNLRIASALRGENGVVVGQNARMKELFELVRRLAPVTTHVLILGESGTGKEVIAKSIHNQGPRSPKPFVAINCAAIPTELLESELFGHAKGSFTGAVAHKKGLFEEADGGTLFLDEVGDMPMTLQAKLLRVLQEKKIRAVGANADREVDVRVIAATHRDLRAMMREGKFREDLYYRLSVVPLMIPPLRDRAEDIPVFAEYFLNKFRARQPHTKVRGFTAESIQKLQTQTWEGNVRQLENAIERAAIMCPNELITPSDLLFLDHEGQHPDLGPAPAMTAPLPSIDNSNGVSAADLNLRELEKQALIMALKQSGGRKEKAAKILGISRKTLYRKEKEYGLSSHSAGEE